MAVSRSYHFAYKQRSDKKKWLGWLMRWLFAFALAAGSWQVLSSGYLLAKSHLSVWMISDAWALTLKDGQPHKPWSWADTHPVAQLEIPRLGESSYILADANGRSLAFGPAHVRESGMPGESKSTVFSGHNDSHFSYLAQVRMGDEIRVTTTEGVFFYQVKAIEVIDSDESELLIETKEQLILTTCYPFDSLTAGGSLRFQVTASKKG